MLKELLVLSVALLPLSALAQTLNKSGYSAADLVPAEWSIKETSGDLNKDGLADLVLLVTLNDSSKMKIRDDGYVYDYNEPILAVYFAVPEGGYRLWKEYKGMIPHRIDEYISVETTVGVTNRGALSFDVEYFSSAGSWVQTTTTYLFRFQNGDFYLIGSEEMEFARNTGESVKRS